MQSSCPPPRRQQGHELLSQCSFVLCSSVPLGPPIWPVCGSPQMFAKHYAGYVEEERLRGWEGSQGWVAEFLSVQSLKVCWWLHNCEEDEIGSRCAWPLRKWIQCPLFKHSHLVTKESRVWNQSLSVLPRLGNLIWMQGSLAVANASWQ